MKNKVNVVPMTKADVFYFKEKIMPFFAARGVAEKDIEMLADRIDCQEWSVHVKAPAEPFREDDSAACEEFEKFYAELGGNPDCCHCIGVDEDAGTFEAYVTVLGKPEAPRFAKVVETPAEWWKSGVVGKASPLPAGKCIKARLMYGPYDAIASGEKREEYRDTTPYWHDRLDNRNVTAIHFYKGMTGQEMTWEVTGVTIEDEDTFVIALGKRLA